MKECIFCKIVKTGNNNNEKERNVILYEDDLVLITQATGSPVHLHLIPFNFDKKIKNFECLYRFCI